MSIYTHTYTVEVERNPFARDETQRTQSQFKSHTRTYLKRAFNNPTVGSRYVMPVQRQKKCKASNYGQIIRPANSFRVTTTHKKPRLIYNHDCSLCIRVINLFTKHEN